MTASVVPAATRLLVITLSNIGDLVLTTPVFETLASRYPGARIDAVGDARSIALLASAPYIGDLHTRDKRGGWRAQLALLRRLRRQRYDLVVDLRTPFLPWLLRARARLTNPHRLPADTHAARDHHAVLAPLLGVLEPPPARLYLAADAVNVAARMLGVLPGRRWLAVAPGANWPGKKWPKERFAELLTHCAQLFDGVIVLGSAADAEDCAVLHDAPLPLLDTTGATSLAVAAAVLARASLFVGNDSGLGHMAAALGVPTLTLFGPGRPERYRPWGERARVLLAPQSDLSLLSAQSVFETVLGMTIATPATRP